MLKKHVKLLCFLLTLPSIFGGHDKQRSQIDVNLRGHSFGLENFLFQSYENEDKHVFASVRPKGIRPTTEHYRTSSDRIYAYGLENLHPHLYESNKLKPTPVKPIREFQKRRPVESAATLGLHRGTAGLRQEEPTTQKAQEAETTQQDFATKEPVTERIRKRIMMRRRKRPTNTIPTEESNEGNAIVKPVRIPVLPQGPKVVIRTKVPSTEAQRIRPVGVKSIKTTTSAPEIVYAESIIEREEVTTQVIEKSTASTTQETTTTEKPSTINLKTFLKQQTETLSLSELLQTQNLSLADLLRGNKDASAILKARQSISSTTPTPSVGLKKKIFNRMESTTEIVEEELPKKTEIVEQELPKKMEIMEVTTSRPNYNRFYPKLPRIKPRDQGNHKPEEKPSKNNEDNSEEIPKTIKNVISSIPQSIDPQTRLSELRSKLRNFQRKNSLGVTQTETPSEVPVNEEIIETVSVSSHAPVTKSTESPYKRNRISFKSSNNPELSVILTTKSKQEGTEKRPYRITNWTNRLPPSKRFGQEKTQSDNLILKPLKVPILVNDSESSEENSFDDEEVKTTLKPLEEVKVPPEEIRKPEAKDELIELLKFGHNADRLQKILFSRNMTLQELLENREKPPLQMNITELFSSHQKEVKMRSTTQSTYIFDSLPDFDLEEENKFKASDSVGYDEPYAEESVPSIVRVELPVIREPKQFDLSVTKNDGNSQLLQPDDLQADTSNAENSALWKLSEKSIYYGSSYGFGDEVTTKQLETEKPQGFDVKDELTENDIILLKTLRRNQETNRKFKLDLNEFMRKEEDEPVTEDIEKSYIPPAVKSAIIASGVVMGIALFVFIAIFATCGWKQRQIRLKGASSILEDTLTKAGKSKRTNTLSPVSFKENNSYKKTIDFDEESESGTSNTSSYLWNTLKNTFRSRTSTLKSTLEKEERMREDKMTLRRNESRRKVESRLDDRPDSFDERSSVKKIDRDRNVINTSFNFKRSPSNNNVHHFNDCAHEY